jgi:hypothetical protein
MRNHDVTALTGRELEQARRELAASLALARPGSPARVPILTQMKAIDAELAGRSGPRPGELPGSPSPLILAGQTTGREDAPVSLGAGASLCPDQLPDLLRPQVVTICLRLLTVPAARRAARHNRHQPW